MRVIDEYGACWAGAVKLQSLYRARAAVRKAEVRSCVHMRNAASGLTMPQAARQLRLQNWTARRLQSVFRGRRARKCAALTFERCSHALMHICRYAIVMRMLHNKKTEAARCIQVLCCRAGGGGRLAAQ